MLSFRRFLALSIAFTSTTLFSKTDYRIIAPKEISSVVLKYAKSHPDLSTQVLSKRLQTFLTKRGYTFAQVSIDDNSGLRTISVKPGIYGQPSISGNKHLSNIGILENLGWENGKAFNYSNFYNHSARLNKNRFVQVDTKLKPVRSDNGEIQVNADFEVEDRFPVSPYIRVSNDGSRQTSGWRATLGAEFWESLMTNDRFNLSYTMDPQNASKQFSSFASYQFGTSGFRQSIYFGYSDSSNDNLVSSLDMDIVGKGFFTGYSAVVPVGFLEPGEFDLNFGLNYSDLKTQIDVGGANFSDHDLALLLPKIGLQGEFSNPLGLTGKSYWSISIISDLSTSDNEDLRSQNPELDRGFWVPQFSFAALEAIDFLGIDGGFKFKIDGQFASEPLPASLKKPIGGVRSIRGYDEREALGDSGMCLNLEYSFNSEKTSLFGAEGNLQKVFFYDAGYVSNEGSLSSVSDSIGMQSFGVGLVGDFEQSTNFSLQFGVPIENTFNTNAHDVHTHFAFSINF